MVQGLKMSYASGPTSNKTKITAQEKVCAFKPGICSASPVGAERERARRLNRCQLIFVSMASLTREAASHLGLMIRSSVGSSHNSQLKHHHDTQHWREEEEGGERGVKPNPWLDSLLERKVRKVYCLSNLRAIQRGTLLSQDASEMSLSAWPSCVFVWGDLTCFSFAGALAKMKVIWSRKSASVIWGCHACHVDTRICLEHLELICLRSMQLASCAWKAVQLDFIIKLALKCIMQLPWNLRTFNRDI